MYNGARMSLISSALAGIKPLGPEVEAVTVGVGDAETNVNVASVTFFVTMSVSPVHCSRKFLFFYKR